MLNGGAVILDSRRLQIRNGSEDVKRGRACGIGAKGLERRARVPRLRTNAGPIWRGGIDGRVVARVRSEWFEQQARIFITRRCDREHAEVRVCKRSGSGTLEGIRSADSGKIRYVVGHGITNSERSLAVAEDVPSQASARAEVLKVEVIEAREALLHLDQPVRKPRRRADGWLRRSTGKEMGGDLVGVTQRTIDVPTQAVADRQAWGHFPFVLEKQSHRGLVEMARTIAKRAGSLIEASGKQLVDKRLEISCETSQGSPRPIAQTERGGVLIIAAKLKAMFALDPVQADRRVIGLNGAGTKRVAYNATRISVGHRAGIDRRHAEIGGVQGACVDAKVQGINLVFGARICE